MIFIGNFIHPWIYGSNYDCVGAMLKFIEDLHSGKLHREYHYGPDHVEDEHKGRALQLLTLSPFHSYGFVLTYSEENKVQQVLVKYNPPPPGLKKIVLHTGRPVKSGGVLPLKMTMFIWSPCIKRLPLADLPSLLPNCRSVRL